MTEKRTQNINHEKKTSLLLLSKHYHKTGGVGKIIKKTDVLISFGYGYDASFELGYIKTTGKNVNIYDNE